MSSESGPESSLIQSVNSTIADGVSGCKWLVFDAVGTLIDPDPSVGVAYHCYGARYGSRLTLEEVGLRFRRSFRSSEHDGFPGGPAPTETWQTSDDIEEARWRWIVQDVLEDVFDQDACFLGLWEHFARPESWKCFADVPSAIRRLKAAGYQLAIATNFDRRLHSVCDATPPLDGISVRVVSATVRYRKPAPEFYQAVISACQCAPHQILVVGDNHDYDVLAPRSAGMKALLLDRDSTNGDPGILTSLDQLAELMIREKQPSRSA